MVYIHKNFQARAGDNAYCLYRVILHQCDVTVLQLSPV